MQKSNMSRVETPFQVLHQDSASGPDHVSQAETAEQNQHTPGRVLQALRRALLDSKTVNQQLAAENSALKEQMACREIDWEHKYQELLDEKAILVKTANKNHQQFDDHCRKMDMKLRGKVEEVHSLRKDLHHHKVEIRRVIKYWQQEYEKMTAFWKSENDKISKVCQEEKAELECSSNKTVTELKATWESKWSQQEKVLAEQKTLQEDLERKLSQVTHEKQDLISVVREKKKALVENMFQLSQREVASKQSEAAWRRKYESLEDGFKMEMQRQRQQLEEEWRHKASQMEEEIKLLNEENAQLQVRHIS
ncbi:nuclear matrix constituent protein 1a-like [Thunnus albacares]|uniref:nuclear matrix constituent protein 1a-like n=1 Tax=Thunnus albacares TaxID=8236 RepID=UPI001CF64717|nr:nuclear matrix constituent protein 1a-like [Thunnus albacares]